MPVPWNAIIGGGVQALGGYLGDRERRRSQEDQQAHQRDLSGQRGWDVVDPLLRGAAGEAQAAYDARRQHGDYASNVPRPTRGSGASAGARQIADRARQVALGGPGQGTQAGLDYAEQTLGGGGPEGGAASYYRSGADAYGALPGGEGAEHYRRGGEMFGELPGGVGGSMYQHAFGEAANGSNPYIGGVFDLARGAFSGTSAGGGGGGMSTNVNLDPNQFNIDPNQFNIDPNAEGLTIDPTGGAIGGPEAWDTQQWVGQMYGENAPVGAGADIRAMLDDPFAMSNPHVEEMIRQQQEDLQRSHEFELGRLGEAAGNIGSYGGGDFQLARAQMSGELGRNTERAGTSLRYQDFQDSMGRFMEALNLGSSMDATAAGQALQAEIFNRSDLTDRQKADLAAQVTREIANQGTRQSVLQGNQGTQAGLAQGNQGTQADLATTGAALSTQRAIANQSNATARNATAQQAQADYLRTMLGAAGLQNESDLGRLGAMGNFAAGLGQLEGMAAEGQFAAGAGLGALEQAGAEGQFGAAAGLGQLELGSLGAIPGLEGIEMGRLGQASGIQGNVDRQNAAAEAAYNAQMSAWNRDRYNVDHNQWSSDIDDLIRQGRNIGGHYTTPTGMGDQPGGGGGGYGGAAAGGLGALGNVDPSMLRNFFGGGGGVNPFTGASGAEAWAGVTPGANNPLGMTFGSPTEPGGTGMARGNAGSAPGGSGAPASFGSGAENALLRYAGQGPAEHVGQGLDNFFTQFRNPFFGAGGMGGPDSEQDMPYNRYPYNMMWTGQG